jgi:aminoglycoside phosphotransferase (APT) family kinase protein
MVALSEMDIPARTVALAAPLAYLEDLHVLLQGPVDEEETLKALAYRTFRAGNDDLVPRLASEIGKVAEGLAALHACEVVHGDTVTWHDELAEVRELVDRLASRLPEVAAGARPYLDALEDLSGAHRPDPAGPAHRSFRPAQVLLSGAGLAFIDFDGMCTAEPAIDVALFRTTLRDIALATAVTPADVDRLLVTLDALGDTFVERYRSARPISSERVALWEGLDLLTLVLHCWTKVKPARLDRRMAMLEHHLRVAPVFR